MSTMDLQTLADHLEKGGTTPTEVISFAIKMGYLTESARGHNKSGLDITPVTKTAGCGSCLHWIGRIIDFDWSPMKISTF